MAELLLEVKNLKGNSDLEMTSKPCSNLFYAEFNTTRKPFNDPRVRLAANHAINMDKLVEVIYQGMGTRAINALPPMVFAFDNTAGPYEYNPEKAKALLVEAGYADGVEFDLYTFLHSRPYVAQPVQVAEIIKGDLEKVGFKVNIVTNEWATHSDIMMNFKHDFAFTGWYDIPHPNNFLKSMLIDSATSGYKSEVLEELALKALDTYDATEQEEYYKQMQQLIFKDAPIIPIAHNNYTAGFRKNVKGFRVDALGTVWAVDAYKE